MTKIELLNDVTFGDAEKPVKVTEITVKPIRFAEFVKIWKMPHLDPSKPELSLQKRRIMHQAHFMVGENRYVPDVRELGEMDFRTVRTIIDALEIGQGQVGKVVSKKADGLSKPIIYQLGDPIEMGGAGGDATVKELEFQGSTYAELEDVLAADNNLEQTLALFRKVGRPVGGPLSMLTEGMIERISMADGVTIMQDVLPAF